MAISEEERKARQREANKRWRAKNKDKVAAYKKKHYAENKERILKQQSEYAAKNKDKKATRDKARYHANIDQERERGRKNDAKRRKKKEYKKRVSDYNKNVYYPKNRELVYKRAQKWKKENREFVRALERFYKSKRKYGDYAEAHRILLEIESQLNDSRGIPSIRM